MATELGLPQWWLNKQASVYVAPGGDPDAPVTFDHPGLRVSAASPEHLLAMNALAARRRDLGDLGDLRLLVGLLGLTTPEHVVEVTARVFPDEPLPDRARLILAELFEDPDASEPAGLTRFGENPSRRRSMVRHPPRSLSAVAGPRWWTDATSSVTSRYRCASAAPAPGTR